MLNLTKQKKDIVVDTISGLFILLFIYASISKIQDFQKFKVELGKSPILSSFPEIIAGAVPIVEICLSLLLISKRFQLVALYAAFSLMVMFSAYITVIIYFSTYIPCSCGGVLQSMSWTQHLVFNIGFIIMATIAVLCHPSEIKNLSAVRG